MKDKKPSDLMSQLLEQIAKQAKGQEPFAVVSIHKKDESVVTEKTPVVKGKLQHQEKKTETKAAE